MAMVGSDLGAAIKSAIDALGTDVNDRDTLFSAMGAAIVTYLQAHAVVSVTVATTGTASAQTGTGTGTIS